MSRALFFTDEDIYAAVALGLRRNGLDAVSTVEVGRRGQSDDSQLAFAASEYRVLVSFNVAHFAALHSLCRSMDYTTGPPRSHFMVTAARLRKQSTDAFRERP